MKISSFDLNLFVILNAIYTEGSLTKAAHVVGITQPAVSNALSRLREKFNDELFIRTGSGMVPTQKTENMIKDIQGALALMQQSVNEPDTFDSTQSNRTFKLSLGDISEGRVLPFLMQEIYKNAPKISVGSYGYNRKEQVHALSTNNLDFVVDPIIPASDEINSYKLSYTVSDELSITYGSDTVERPGLVDGEYDSVSASYTAGGMTLTATFQEAENMDGTTGATQDRERWALGASFAF